MQLLVGEREMALDTMRAFHALWRHLGFHPEGFNLASMQVQPGQLGYPLRPEHVESLFWAHRTTHGGEWLRAGRDVLRSLQTLRVPCGVVCLSDVANRTREDNMESFFLSETTKYLYLLFDPDDEVYEHGRYVFTTEAHILPLDLYNLTGDQGAVEAEAAEVAEALRQLGSDYDDDDETNGEQEGRGGGEGGESQAEEEEGAREGRQPANGAQVAAGGGTARLALQGGCAMPSYKHLLGFYGNAPHGSNSQVEIEEALKGQQQQRQQQQEQGQQGQGQPKAAGGAAAPAQEASRDPSAELAVRRGALLGLSHRTVQQPAALTGRGAAGAALDEAIRQLEEAGRRPGGAASAEVEQRQRRVEQEQRRADEAMVEVDATGDDEIVAEQAQCHPLDAGCGGSMVQEEHAESMAALELAPLWEEALRLGLTDETSLGSMRGHMARGRWSARHYVGMWRRRIAAHTYDATHPATPRAAPLPLPNAVPSVAGLLPNLAGLPNAARLPPSGEGGEGGGSEGSDNGGGGGAGGRDGGGGVEAPPLHGFHFEELLSRRPDARGQLGALRDALALRQTRAPSAAAAAATAAGAPVVEPLGGTRAAPAAQAQTRQAQAGQAQAPAANSPQPAAVADVAVMEAMLQGGEAPSDLANDPRTLRSHNFEALEAEAVAAERKRLQEERQGTKAELRAKMQQLLKRLTSKMDAAATVDAAGSVAEVAAEVEAEGAAEGSVEGAVKGAVKGAMEGAAVGAVAGAAVTALNSEAIEVQTMATEEKAKVAALRAKMQRLITQLGSNMGGEDAAVADAAEGAAEGGETPPVEDVAQLGASTQHLGVVQPGALQMLGGNEALQRALQGAAGGSVQLGGAELEGLQQMLQQAGVASDGGTGSQQVQFVVLDSDGQQQTVQLQMGSVEQQVQLGGGGGIQVGSTELGGLLSPAWSEAEEQAGAGAEGGASAGGTAAAPGGAAAIGAGPAEPAAAAAAVAAAAQVGVGHRVQVRIRGQRAAQRGIVRFVGGTAFKEGPWVGVQLDSAVGKNDGSVDGTRYFRCRAGYGIFVRPTHVTPLREPPPSIFDEWRAETVAVRQRRAAVQQAAAAAEAAAAAASAADAGRAEAEAAALAAPRADGGDGGSSAGGGILVQPPPQLVIFGSGANGSYAPPQVGGKLCASFSSLTRYRLVAAEQQQAAAATASAPRGLQGLFQRLSSSMGSMGSLLFGGAAGSGAQLAPPGRPQLGDTVEVTDAAHRHTARMAVVVQEWPLRNIHATHT